MSHEKIAVLVAAYNGEKYIAEQMHSILDQTYRDLRVIVLDDVSTDKTYEILLEVASEDCRVEVYKNSKNIGVLKTFERLMGFVEEPLFCLADQDDVWKKDKLESQVACLNSEGLVLVYSDLVVVDEKLQVIAPSMWKFSGIRPVKSGKSLPFLIRNPATGCTVLARSELIKACVPIAEDLPMHDWWLVLRAAQIGLVGYVDRCTVNYRQHASNVLGAKASDWRGFRRRTRNLKGSVMRYSKYRYERRIKLAAAAQKFSSNRVLWLYLAFHTMPWFGRIITLPAYLTLLMLEARRCGLRALCIDVAMFLVPRYSGG